MESPEALLPELPPVQAEEKPHISVAHFLMELFQTLVMALILYFLIDSLIARVRVENISMEPTLLPGEFVLVNKVAYRLGDFQRGDIVVFHYPPNPKEDYIKRIVGVSGDDVQVHHGLVFVNGIQLNEPYIAAPPLYVGAWKVPEGTIFVLGDNRNQSSDSHSWGFVPSSYVVGRALAIYWPFDKMRTFNDPNIMGTASIESPLSFSVAVLTARGSVRQANNPVNWPGNPESFEIIQDGN